MKEEGESIKRRVVFIAGFAPQLNFVACVMLAGKQKRGRKLVSVLGKSFPGFWGERVERCGGSCKILN